MNHLILSAAAIATLLGASLAVGGVQAEPQGRLIVAVDRGDAQPLLQDAQFLFGGRNYCWYDSGWRGPGFYWCGYASRQGLGWGGGAGWNGWQRGGHGGVRSGVRAGGARMSAARSGQARGGARAGAARTASRGGARGHAGGHKPGK